jgi:hypothetical protein
MAYGPHAGRRGLRTVSTSPQTTPKFEAKMEGLRLSMNHEQHWVGGGVGGGGVRRSFGPSGVHEDKK